MNNGRVLTPQQLQQPVGLQVAQPINDVQLLCLMASHIQTGTPAERVAMAQDIFAEAIVNQDRVPAKIQALAKARQDLDNRPPE